MFKKSTLETLEVDYIILKNALVERVSGEILIPESQIKMLPTPPPMLSAGLMLISENCTYCHRFVELVAEEERCIKCPMYRDNNHCDDPHSTYETAEYYFELYAERKDRKELKKLAIAYNERLKELT